MLDMAPMDAFSREVFAARLTDDGVEVEHDVYTRGEGPVVVLIQELPGIGPETLRLADTLNEAGFSVVIPHLFGPLGKTATLGNLGRVLCMRRELSLFAARRSSPTVRWLRSLCRHVCEARDVPGVGVIGMCLTGNFAISLMAEGCVVASVASQPSMPIIPQSAIQMSDDDVTAVRQRLDEVGPMLAYRFEGDLVCGPKKFEALRRRFNDDRERIRLRTLPGPGHAVLTLDFVDETGHPTRQALDEVISYFRRRLPDPEPSSRTPAT